MMNRIQILVHLMNGADILRHVYLVQVRIELAVNSLMYKLEKKYQIPYTTWRDKGFKDFYSMIKNHKR